MFTTTLIEGAMDGTCPHCGLAYDDLRTGETYSTIYEQFWSGSDDPTTWVNKRRHTILGRWRQVKLSMWAEHLELCEKQAEYAAQLETIESADSFAQDAELGVDFNAFEAFMHQGTGSEELPVPF